MISEPTPAHGGYIGRLLLEPLSDGRRMKLFEEFGFIDAAGQRWQVPKNAIVDGASIPQPLWSVMGGPFEGKYRDASVIHDFFCDVRTYTWRAVHRVFYEAMRVSGVSEARAKLMYAAVYFGGPRWSDTVIHNANLPTELPPKKIKRRHKANGVKNIDQHSTDFGSALRSTYQKDIVENEIFSSISLHPPSRLKNDDGSFTQQGAGLKFDTQEAEFVIGRTNPSLDQIDEAIDMAGLLANFQFDSYDRKII